MAEYTRRQQRLVKRGMNISFPGDRLTPEWFQVLQNVRSYRLGEWRQRPGFLLIASLPEAFEILHLARINDNTTNTFRRLAANSAGNVYFDNALHNVYTLQDSGYQAGGYSSVISRPDRSPLPFLFLASAARQGKFSTVGDRTEWGLVAPTVPITSIELFGKVAQTIDDCESAAGFTGTGGAVTAQTRVGAVAISQILYFQGPPGFVSVAPATMSENFQEGMFITFSVNPETTIIESVFPALPSTTIGSISYDSGASGPCCIQLATPTLGLQKDAMIRLNSAENVRVLSVTEGPDGTFSLRCSTVATFTSGDTVDIPRSFVAFANNAHTTADTLSTGYVQFAVAGAGTSDIAKTAALNLASFAGRPAQPEDFIHISILAANPTLITSLRLEFDCDATTNTFTENYFTRTITQTELMTGNNQWTELFLRISSFSRVGSDTTRGWANIAAFRLVCVTTAAINIGIDALWCGGTFGPDTTGAPGYTYIYRARNTLTGSRSNPSPPMRSPMFPRRDRVLANIPVGSYPDAQADAFDVFRIGGTLQEYHLIATVTAASPTMVDDVPDDVAVKQEILEFDRFKPWPRPDLPRAGTVDVVGTTVLRVSGDLFNTAWVGGFGQTIVINNKVYSLYTNPASATVLELNESAGTQTGVDFEIQEPLLDGQPQPAVFGPFSGASGEFNFGVGDPLNPGFLRWTNGNDPESASDANSIELCGPSERMMNGVVLDGVVFAYSDRRSWRIFPSFSGGQTGAGSDFYPQETAMGKGLAGRWAITVGDAIYFVAYDGIYRTRGDALESLTDPSLAPLFRKEGSSQSGDPFFVFPLEPIDFSPAAERFLTLTWSYDGIYLTYQGTITSSFFSLYYSFFTGGWVLDYVAGDILPNSITRVIHEISALDADLVVVGTSQGMVLQQGSGFFEDAGEPINCRIYDRFEDGDDIRSTKRLGDFMIDIDPGGETIHVAPHYDNDLGIVESLDDIPPDSGRQQYVRDIPNGAERVVRNVALDFFWTGQNLGLPKLYAWDVSWLLKPEEIVNRVTDWDGGGYTGSKWLQGFRLRGDTEGTDKDFSVEVNEQGIVTTAESFTFNSNGEGVLTYWFTNPQVCHEMRLRGTDGDLWRNMGVEWIFEPEPEQAAVWETQVTSFDLPFFHHIREVMIAHRSTTDITMAIITDGVVSNSYSIPASAGQRVRSYLPVKGIKSKYHKFRFTSSAPFGLWIADIECRVGAWGRQEAYTTQRPFGDISRTNGGARI